MKKSLLLTLFIFAVSFAQVDAQKKLRSFDEEDSYAQTQTYKSRSSSSNYFNPGFIPAMEIGYGFIDDGYAYSITIGANYEFVKNLYAGARIGYNGVGYSFYEYGISFNSNAHLLSIPFELGYTIVTENKFGVVPFVGLGFNVGLGGKTEVNDYDVDLEVGGKLCVDARAGLRLMLAGWTISGTYHFPLNEKQEEFFGVDAYPEISIGWFLFD